MNAPFPAVSAEFITDLYHRYLRDPASVDAGWIPYFDQFYGHAGSTAPVLLEVAATQIIEAYRQRGHFAARLDPLGLWAPPFPADLLPASYGVDEAALDTVVQAPAAFGFAPCSLRALLATLQRAYAGAIGFDCAHVEDRAARQWLHHAAEQGAPPSVAERRTAAERLIEGDDFEDFMNRRFVGKKRFGAEGAEAILPWFDAALARSAALGVRDVVIAGTSRSRLNTMANVVGKPLTALFYEVKGHRPFPADTRAAGDVPYHFGYAGEKSYGGATVKLTYCHNPSHLEAVDGVALGRVRARQRGFASEADGWREVLGITVHTDAAFAGQGVVGEVLQLNRIPSYRTGGSIRLVINNQVGFTTDPEHGRSSTFCTDIAKAVGAPVLHVNGDDIDAVVRCGQIAAEYRHRFGGDIVVDLVCYRRRGHNEVDEPSFTQPVMVRRIAAQQKVRDRYVGQLIAEKVLTSAEAQAMSDAYGARLEASYEAIGGFRPNYAGALGHTPAANEKKNAPAAPEATGLSPERLQSLGLALSQPPAGVDVNPKIVRQLGEREAAIRSGEKISWAFAEALAYGSLACDGVPVRLSGQDTPRGAFSQRHFVLIDQTTGAPCEPLNMMQKGQARCDIIGSPLAEYAVLGFEYGYSLDATEALVVWEAQFGDFANVAQVIVDQFIASADDKWLEPSRLTLLLPHGLEGQGPDHSSGRIERFLQLCAGDNLRVANCTTPANFFHLLRAQGKAKTRRPLVVFTPKSLLRDKRVVSRAEEFHTGAAFKCVIGPETVMEPIRRVVLCSGKIYYDLFAQMSDENIVDVAVLRLEQLYPFPEAALTRELARFPDAEVVWCQEEPENMGAWSYLDRRIEKVLRDLGNGCAWPRCVSRPANASTAIGTTAEHEEDQDRLVSRALNGRD